MCVTDSTNLKAYQVQLEYLSTDDTLTFSILENGSLLFWAYYENQYNTWDEITNHEELLITKDKLIPVLQYLKKVYPEIKKIWSSKKDQDSKPKIIFHKENYSCLNDETALDLYKAFCQFFELKLLSRLIPNHFSFHIIIRKLALFFLQFFLVYKNSVYIKYCSYSYYWTIIELKKKLIEKKFIRQNPNAIIE